MRILMDIIIVLCFVKVKYIRRIMLFNKMSQCIIFQYLFNFFKCLEVYLNCYRTVFPVTQNRFFYFQHPLKITV